MPTTHKHSANGFNNSIEETLLSQQSFDCWDLVKVLPTAVYTCDTDGRISYYNEAAIQLWGRRPELGRDLWCGSWKIYNADGNHLSLDEHPMAMVLKEKREITATEVIIERPDGRRINVIPHPKPLFDNSGKICGAVNMLIDITEKKQIEETVHLSEEKIKALSESLERRVDERTMELKKSEEKYHKMIDEVQDYAILLLDTQGTILNWNKGAEKIKGYSENEIIGKNFRIFYQDKDRRQQLPEQLISEAKRSGRATHEGWRLRKNGSKFWGSIVITALHDEDNNVIGFSKVTRDLTEKKLAEDRLKKYANGIESRNKQLEQYAYIASHDLQEPLRKIRIFTELLEKNIDDKEATKKNLGKIDACAERMTNLIKGVLRYSQLSTKELYTPTDLNRILQNVKEDFDMLIEQKNVVITHSELPVINGIPIQLHQLFSNLISNSIKFCNKSPIIEIKAEKPTPNELKRHSLLNISVDYVKIVVKDNGVGFNPEYSSQIFELFKRLNDDNRGTGIGLALCKKIVDNHHGHISVSSQPNVGTSFVIFLPTS